MNDPLQTPDDGLVDRAVSVLRSREIPAPPTGLMESTRKRLTTPQRGPFQLFLRSPAFRVAASFFLVIGVGLLAMWLTNANAKVAFADVLGNLKKINTMRCKQDFTIETALGNIQSSADILLVDPAKMRVDSLAGPAKGATVIVDIPARKALLLAPNKKNAVALSFGSTERSQKCLEEFESRDLFEHFRQWTEKDARQIGPTVLDGKKAIEFRVEKPEYTANLWIDSATQLPIRITFKHMRPNGKTVERTFRDFEFNQSYDPALLELSPPAGYSIERISIDIVDPDESDLIESLRTVATVRGGTFPDDLSPANLLSGATRFNFGAILKNRAGATPKENLQDNINHFLALGRGLLFAGDPEAGSNWHYAGKGATLNTTGRPIFWYLPAGKADYRVIYADLSIKEMSADSLPTIPSVTVSRDTMAPRFRLP